MIYYLISFQKPSSERILITQVVDFSFIDISVERVTGLENKYFGKLITHVIYIHKWAEEGYPVNCF
jgi:hypothetical protein